MNDYEMGKLRKELARKTELLREEQQDREETERTLVGVQAQRDRFHGELVIARQTIENVDQIIAQNVREMRSKLEKENSESFSELQRLRERVAEEKNLNEKLIQENQNKDAVISELSLRLREVARKYQDSSLAVNVKQISEQAVITHNQFYRLTEKYSKLSADAENILAENKILRKLNGVPDNFGFDLEEIKIAEKQELQDFKTQCRRLEAEIQELEAERTQLRYRLRQYNTLYSNKGERYKDMNQQQFELLDQYALNLKEGNREYPQIDKSHKEMEKEIFKLRGQVEVLQSRAPMSLSKGNDQVFTDALKNVQQQVKSVLEPFVQDMRRISAQNSKMGGSVIVSQAKVENGIGAVGDFKGFRPPMPLPIAHNDWSQIKEGYSYAYSSKIPVHIKDDDMGFSLQQAKYQIAALQLQNIESLKLLKQKQTVEDRLAQELSALNQKYLKCLALQDQLFLNYFTEKGKINEKNKQAQMDKEQLKHQKELLQSEKEVLADAYATLSKKSDKTALEQKCSDLATRLSLSDGQLLRIKRKYNILNEETKMLRHSYSNLEAKSAEADSNLRRKLLVCQKNEAELTVLMNTIMSQSQGTVSSDLHNNLLAQLQITKAKSASAATQETQLRLKVSKLESAEREMTLKDQLIETLRQNVLEIELELEIVRSRLESVDDQYKGYRITFDKMLKFISANNVSLISLFKHFDQNNSGQLNKDEFFRAIKSFGFQITSQELELLFSQFDIDGSGTIEYNEFLRKLRRSGVMTRSKDQESLYSLFKAIKQSGISVRKAFQIIDRDGSNSISKGEMETALRSIGIEITSRTAQFIFRACGCNDKEITCSQFQQLFEDIVRDSAVQEQEIFSTEMDWKLDFVLKIQECSTKYHNSLHQTFKLLDSDGNASLQINELEGFINKAGMSIERHKLIELFDFLDRRKDKKVEYSEFLRILEEAHAQKKRIQRIKAVKLRTEQLRKEYEVKAVREGEKFKIGEEASLKVRLMGLEAKQKALIKKNDRLVKALVVKEQEIAEHERDGLEKERELMKTREEYFMEKANAISLQERMKSCLGEEDSRKIQKDVNELRISKMEMETELKMIKGLYESVCDRNKAEELRVGKIEAERDKYSDIVKDLQGNSDLAALVGEKTIEVQYSKRNEEIVNNKYERVMEQIRKMGDENAKLMDQNLEKEREIITTYMLMQEKSNAQQRNIDALTAKILPTVDVSKIDDMLGKVRQVSNSKTLLEDENRQLREKNFNLALRNDYIQNEKVHIQELERKLRRVHTDDSSVAIMDLTKRLAQYKMSELKAKRECGLLKEKEEYYLRVHNSTNDSMKDLENQIANWELKFNEREEFWRNRLSEQSKMVEKIQKEATKAKEEERQAQSYFQGKRQEEVENDRKYEALPESKKGEISSYMRKSTPADGIETRGKIRELEEELLAKEKQIYQLKSALKDIIPEAKFNEIGSQMNVSTHSFVLQTDLTSSQLKNNARRFISSQKEQESYYKEEAARLGQAAQHSIDTLQRIIDEKNEQLRRKDKTIEDLRRDYMRAKEEDFKEIQLLHEKIGNTSMSQIGNKTTNKDFYKTSQFEKADAKVQSLLDTLAVKEQEIRALQDKCDRLTVKQRPVSRAKPDGGPVVEKRIAELQEERERERKKHAESQEQLRVLVKNLEKKTKEKDVKLVKLQNALKDLKQLAINEKGSMGDEEAMNMLGDLIGQMKRGTHANESQMEITLQKLLGKMEVLVKKNKACEDELRRLKEDKFAKTINK